MDLSPHVHPSGLDSSLQVKFLSYGKWIHSLKFLFIPSVEGIDSPPQVMVLIHFLDYLSLQVRVKFLLYFQVIICIDFYSPYPLG